MAVTLDAVSGGRVILGLGAGWHQPEFDAFGIPFDHKVDRFEEALQIIVPLLHEGRVSFQGAHYSAIDCEIVPRGPRPEGPPILIAGHRPRMLRLTARYADSWNTAWYGGVEGIAERRATIEAACRAEGRDPATLEVTVGVNVDYAASLGGGTVQPVEKALSGSADEIAAGLRGYAEAGVGHVMCALNPTNAAALTQLSEALNAFRRGGL
jgi:alkanesulfonate monooxygenase SsuD/methylene tetrahydromethanopterin reductase-like flavin-dependent oxidoreductase (luciferase family)